MSIVKFSDVGWTPSGEYIENKIQNEFKMRDMQANSFTEIKDSRYAILNAPTACGKTMAMCYLISHSLHQDKNRKAIILVPQKIIGAGFATYAKLRFLDPNDKPVWDDGKLVKWCPELDLCSDSDNSSNTEALEEFLKHSYGDHNDRIAICTYATFSRLFKKSADLFDNLLVCCDEAHHVQFSNHVFKEERNCLGGFLKFAIENESKDIRIILSTATFYRGDGKEIIPQKYIDRFDKFYYPMNEYLRKCRYLSGFSYNFAMYESQWGKDLSKLYDSTTKSKFIAYIPSVNSKRYSYGSKHEDVQKIYESIAGKLNPEIKEEESGLTLIRRENEWIKVVNLVDDGDEKLREKRLNLIIEAHEHDDNSKIDGIITLEMFKEGANWRWADTIFLIGAKGSITQMVQIIGRLLRDAEDKSKVDIYQFLPKNINNLDSNDFRDNLNDHLKVIFSAMVVEDLIMPIRIQEDVESKSKDPVDPKEENFEESSKGVNYLKELVSNDSGEEASILMDVWVELKRLDQKGICLKRNTEESRRHFEDATIKVLERHGIDDHQIAEYSKKVANQIHKHFTFKSIKAFKLNTGIDVSEVDYDLIKDGVIDSLYFVDHHVTGMCGHRDLDGLRVAIDKYLEDSYAHKADEKKQQLLDMARNGEDKPSYQKTKLGQAFVNYTSKSSGSYDEKFDKEIRSLNPKWFVTPSDIANEKKQQLLDMARNGEDKPNQKTKLGQAFVHYTSKSSESYDDKFDKEIRSLSPKWFVTPSDIANEKKQQLLNMAKNGEDKPSRRTKLGQAFVNYTNKSSGCYDEEFDKEIRSLNPKWFINKSDIANEKKQQLLDMARNGEDKPSCHKTKLGQALFSYISKSSNCYDEEFDKEIRSLNPKWFVTPSDIANEKKQQLLNMAKNGEDKPSKRTKLGRAFVNYTIKSSESYDDKFDKEIRSLNPKWFVTPSDIANEKKQQLLDMARNGEERPNQKTKLGQAFVHYTSKSSESYDDKFDKEIRSLSPKWFKKSRVKLGK